MDLGNFVSPDHVLSNILVMTNDEALKEGLNKGWYYNKMYDALSELNFTGYYNKLHKDYHDWYVSGKQKEVPVPEGAFSIGEVHLFNGSKFSIDTSVKVEYKRDFVNTGKLSGHTANVKDSGTESRYSRAYYDNVSVMGTVYYANVQNGCVMLSDSCTAYSHIRVYYVGIGGKLGEAPIVPIFLEKAVHDYVVEQFFRVKKNRDRSFRTLWSDAKRDLEGSGRSDGSWHEALVRIGSMSRFEREAMTRYFQRGNW